MQLEVKIMKFKDLEFEQMEATEGVQAWVAFRNGFEVSVVRHNFSYGGKKGFYEIGVFNAAGSMCDPLDWGDTVKGWLLPSEVVEQLKLIKVL
jgi:hypothetical protein